MYRSYLNWARTLVAVAFVCHISFHGFAADPPPFKRPFSELCLARTKWLLRMVKAPFRPLYRPFSDRLKDRRYARVNDNVETYVVSFPKTGRTWLRTLIGKALIESKYPPEEIAEMDRYAQRVIDLSDGKIAVTHGNERHLMDEGPAEDFRINVDLYRGKKVVLVVRDIRDTLVSYYKHQTETEGVYKGSIKDFIRDKNFGAQKFVAYYTQWFRLQQAHVPAEFHLISYEAMKDDSAAVARDLLPVLGIEGDIPQIAQKAADFSTFSNMKKMEDSGFFISSSMRKNKKGKGGSKMRQGKVGGFADALDADDLAYIDQVVQQQGDSHCDWYYGDRRANRVPTPDPPGE